ncbi:MAG: thioredoxin [Desulfobacteraceae bacterium]|jgi:thioredoxin 1|nr:thioredoxin [Desulfobacteraceae bacterium]
MSGLSQVTDKTVDAQVINSNIPVVIEFWAEWCKPCKAMASVIGELAHEYQGRIKMVQMNVAENQKTPARFGIRSIPALIFFKRGEVKQVIVGAQTKGHVEEELIKLL